MREEVIKRLLGLNEAFYQALAAPFALSRTNPQPGFRRILPYIPQSCERALDVGCGEGRFGRFLLSEYPEIRYVGVDFSANLLLEAAHSIPGAVFYQRDVSCSGSLEDLGLFDVIASMAVLQHIPARQNRVQLLEEMGRQLEPRGRLILSTWQFMDSARQRAKVVDWNAAGLAARDVECDDYLMTWQSGGFGLRYVAYIDQAEMQGLARDAGLEVVDMLRSDGREGVLNLYAILSN